MGNNFPVFFVRDGMNFPDMVHALKPNPKNHIQEGWRIVDLFSHHPEAMHMVHPCPCLPLPTADLCELQLSSLMCLATLLCCKRCTLLPLGWCKQQRDLSWGLLLQFTFLLDDVGIPQDYRHMEGFGVHTFTLINKQGKVNYVKFHWLPTLGTRLSCWGSTCQCKLMCMCAACHQALPPTADLRQSCTRALLPLAHQDGAQSDQGRAAAHLLNIARLMCRGEVPAGGGGDQGGRQQPQPRHAGPVRQHCAGQLPRVDAVHPDHGPRPGAQVPFGLPSASGSMLLLVSREAIIP